MRKIYCIGELLIDFYQTKTTQEDNTTNFVMHAGGAPANVAVTVSRLGKEAYFLGQIGNDFFGQFLLETLLTENVHIDYISRTEKTTLAFIALDESGKRNYIFRKGTDFDYVLTLPEKELTENSIVHFGSTTALAGGMLRESYFRLLEWAKEKRSFISFDPNYRSSLITKEDLDSYIRDCLYFMRFAHVIKVNAEEAMLLTRKKSLIEAIEILLAESLAPVLITLGDKGTLVVMNGQYFQVPSSSTKLCDPTGAGDAFVGGVLWGVANQDKNEFNTTTWSEIVTFANEIGSITSEKIGAINAIPNLNEVTKRIQFPVQLENN